MYKTTIFLIIRLLLSRDGHRLLFCVFGFTHQAFPQTGLHLNEAGIKMEQKSPKRYTNLGVSLVDTPLHDHKVSQRLGFRIQSNRPRRALWLTRKQKMTEYQDRSAPPTLTSPVNHHPIDDSMM